MGIEDDGMAAFCGTLSGLPSFSRRRRERVVFGLSPEFSTRVEKYVEKRQPDGLGIVGRPENARFLAGESPRRAPGVGIRAAGAVAEPAFSTLARAKVSRFWKKRRR
jgi:hypothetical protein